MSTITETSHSGRMLLNEQVPATSLPSGPVTATITFYAPPPDNAAPYNYVSTPPAGSPQRNYADDDHAVRISDLRGTPESSAFTLDTSGFQPIAHAPTSMRYEDWA